MGMPFDRRLKSVRDHIRYHVRLKKLQARRCCGSASAGNESSREAGTRKRREVSVEHTDRLEWKTDGLEISAAQSTALSGSLASFSGCGTHVRYVSVWPSSEDIAARGAQAGNACMVRDEEVEAAGPLGHRQECEGIDR
jgi:hypothetical protein